MVGFLFLTSLTTLDPPLWAPYSLQEMQKIDDAVQRHEYNVAVNKNYEVDVVRKIQYNVNNRSLQRKIRKTRVMWLWQKDDGKYTPYSPENSRLLELALLAREAHCTVQDARSGNSWNVYLVEMCQKGSFLRQRPVKRVGPALHQEHYQAIKLHVQDVCSAKLSLYLTHVV